MKIKDLIENSAGKFDKDAGLLKKCCWNSLLSLRHNF